jgi:uncharacterized membrane protein
LGKRKGSRARLFLQTGAAIQGNELVRIIRSVIEWSTLTIEILGASVIVAGTLRVAITRGAVRFLFQLDRPGAAESYKHQMGRSLLLGLEFLVAGDVVWPVALGPTLDNVVLPGRRDRRALAVAGSDGEARSC